MSLSEIAQCLVEKANTLRDLSVVTGIDGFVDKLILVVAQRYSLDDHKRIETISHFGETISSAAGHSSLREIVIRQVNRGRRPL